MSSNSGEYLPQEPNITSEDLPSEELGTIRESLTDTDNVIRCIGCPFVEKCIQKAEEHTQNGDLGSASAYSRYAESIQEGCKGPLEIKSRVPFKSPLLICGSKKGMMLPRRIRRGR